MSIISDLNLTKSQHILPPANMPTLCHPGCDTNQLEFLRKKVITALLENTLSWPFRKPIAARVLQLPDNRTIVEQPMDLETIEKRLIHNYYRSSAEAMKDFELIFDNCYMFYPPDDLFVSYATSLEKQYVQLIQEMPTCEKGTEVSLRGRNKRRNVTVKKPCSLVTATNDNFIDAEFKIFKKIPIPSFLNQFNIILPDTKSFDVVNSSSEISKITKLTELIKFIMEKLKENSIYAWPFYKPINTNIKGFDNIIIKESKDLATIKRNVENSFYKSVDDVAYDIRLIFTNCYKYYPENHAVSKMAGELQLHFERDFAKIR